MKCRYWMVFVLVCGLFGQSQPPPPAPSEIGGDKQEHKGAKGTEGDNPRNTIPMPSAPAVGQNQTGNKARDESKDSPSNWWLIIPTIVIAVATGIQVWIYCQQATYMWRGLHISIRQNRIANKTAIAAKKSTEAAITQFEVTQRPWCKIGLSACQGITFRDDTMFFDFVVEIENVGLSPATSYHYECAIKLQHEGGPTLTELRKGLTETAIKRAGHEFVLFPKDPRRGGFTETRNITGAPDLIAVNVVVVVAYRSTFSNSPKATSTIFYVHHRVNGTFKKGQDVAWADIRIDADPMYATVAN